MYKNQLQELAQRSCFNFPSYTCIREGPDHAPRFKAVVNFNGDTFESPNYFSTLRQAEHAATEVALNSLSSRGPFHSLAAKILGLMLRLNSFRSKSFNSSTSTSRSTSPKQSLTPKRNSTSTREKEIREVFLCFDTDNDGKISALELRSYFASIEEYMSHEEAQAVIDDVDTDGDGMIDFRDFMKLMMNKEEEGDDVKAAFEVFECGKGSGKISPKSLQKALSRLGDLKSYDECVDMIRVFDTHGKGCVDFNEFQEMMMA